MARTPYRQADEAVAKITTKIHREFRHNRLALFDELNTAQTSKHITKLYKKIYKIVKAEYAAILDYLVAEIADEAAALGFDGDIRDLDEGWIEEFFEEYNPVTKYVFSNELDRKKARLFEALVASVAEKHKSYQTAENLLMRQIRQSGIDFEDAVARTVYRKAGVTKVKWNAEKDHKTCGVCAELDGQVFQLEDAPPKAHYHCRCWYTPVK